MDGWACAFPGALPATRRTLAGLNLDDAWRTHLFVVGSPGEIVGWGDFKARRRTAWWRWVTRWPRSDRGRGIATAATLAMVEQAGADDRVTTAIAHTLPESGPSTRVLEKAGFVLEGYAHEHGGPVWRFSRPVRTARD